MVNDGAINKWFTTVTAQNKEQAIAQMTGKYYGAYPVNAVDADLLKPCKGCDGFHMPKTGCK